MESGSVKLENKRLNIIPAGRQLQRTPPSTPTPQPRRRSGDTDSRIKDEEDTPAEGSAPFRPDGVLSPAVKEERKSIRRSSITSASAKMGDADPDAFIQGMQGYQWTDADLEFVYQAKQQKRVQQLQQELSEVLKTLKTETQRLELTIASRDKLQTELSKTLSCERLLQLCRDVRLRSCSPNQLEGLGDKALLSQLQLGDVQHAIHEETSAVDHLKREVAKAQEIREREELAMKEMDHCQKNINIVKANIEVLRMELTELKAQLSEKEVSSKTAQPTGRARKASRTGKAQTASSAPKPAKEKTPKASSTSKMRAHESKIEPVDQNVQPPETEEAPKVSRVAERAHKAPRTAKATASLADGVVKVPKEKVPKEKVPKEKVPKEKAPKEKAPKEKAPAKEKMPAKGKPPKEKASTDMSTVELHTVGQTEQNLQPPETQASKATRATAKARKAAKPTKAPPSPSESATETLRRSKRIATKSQSQSETALQKASGSRRR
ncbi:proteoglycan 4 isoform X1 [Pygocentrus nattereri]|uniref:Si:dkeyp-34c12.1 n=1 Tax=Pygocentrus nattereri TaxID=42514 RepID=A0A3B4DAB8_PYGNA|nr:proteoglycan 4 isoform X1 [Pygocentrus nattereri]